MRSVHAYGLILEPVRNMLQWLRMVVTLKPDTVLLPTSKSMTKVAADSTYPVSIQTERVERLDEYGQAIGYSLIGTSDWGSWVDHYDLADRLVGGRYEDGQGFTSEWSQQLDALDNVIESRFESSDGSWEAANRVEAPDVPFGGRLPLARGVDNSITLTERL